MSTPITSVRNLGPASESAFRAAGIVSAEDLRELGADAAYSRLLSSGSRPHFIAYYALVMGLQGRPWNDCAGEEKVALRKRFDALVANTSVSPISSMTQALDEVGVRIARTDKT